MKIIHLGSAPENRVHQAICYHCRSTVEFEQREAEHVNDQRDGDFLRIECPVCRHMITKSV